MDFVLFCRDGYVFMMPKFVEPPPCGSDSSKQRTKEFIVLCEKNVLECEPPTS